jgi:transposase
MGDTKLDDSLEDSHQAGHQATDYRRIELITGEARRRRWTADEKARILAESFQPGASVSEVALRYGLNRGLLWAWRHEARKRGAIGAPTFVPLRIVAEHAAAPVPSTAAESEAGAGPATSGKPEDGQAGAAPGSIEIEHRGVLVRVNGVVDATALREVLLYLGRRS